jgi:hypothetical protein
VLEGAGHIPFDLILIGAAANALVTWRRLTCNWEGCSRTFPEPKRSLLLAHIHTHYYGLPFVDRDDPVGVAGLLGCCLTPLNRWAWRSWAPLQQIVKDPLPPLDPLPPPAVSTPNIASTPRQGGRGRGRGRDREGHGRGTPGPSSLGASSPASVAHTPMGRGRPTPTSATTPTAATPGAPAAGLTNSTPPAASPASAGVYGKVHGSGNLMRQQLLQQARQARATAMGQGATPGGPQHSASSLGTASATMAQVRTKVACRFG